MIVLAVGSHENVRQRQSKSVKSHGLIVFKILCFRCPHGHFFNSSIFKVLSFQKFPPWTPFSKYFFFNGLYPCRRNNVKTQLENVPFNPFAKKQNRLTFLSQSDSHCTKSILIKEDPHHTVIPITKIPLPSYCGHFGLDKPKSHAIYHFRMKKSPSMRSLIMNTFTLTVRFLR